jgi:hypothetical protein
MEPTGRGEHVTNLVADWAARDPVHDARLRDAAQRGPEVLERAVYNILRSSGGPGSTARRLRQTLTAADMELIDWVKVARLLLNR